MPSSYQVVLWKQDSLVVLRLLQIEFFRSLLEPVVVAVEKWKAFDADGCDVHG